MFRSTSLNLKKGLLPQAVVAAALAFGFSFVPAAHAQSYVIAAVVKNNTPNPVAFQARLDGGTWLTYRLQPGQTANFSLPYPGGINKTVYIRYDSGLTDGSRVTFANTTLAMHSCRHPSQGRLQNFIITNSGRTLYLAR